MYRLQVQVALIGHSASHPEDTDGHRQVCLTHNVHSHVPAYRSSTYCNYTQAIPNSKHKVRIHVFTVIQPFEVTFHKAESGKPGGNSNRIFCVMSGINVDIKTERRASHLGRRAK